MDGRRVIAYCCLAAGCIGLVVGLIGFFSQALEEPVTTDQLVALGEERLRGGDLAGAAEWFAKAAAAAPERVEPVLLAGRVHELRGDVDAAVVAYRRASELAPDALEAPLALARVLARAGSRSEARVTLEQVRRDHPDALEPLVQLAQLSLDSGDQQGALEAYEELAALRPDDPRGVLGVAAVAELSGDVAGARDAYARATVIDDENRAAWEGVGRLAVAASQLEAAEQAYRRVVRLEENDAGALTVLATIVERRQRFPEAERLFRQAIALLEDATGDSVQTRALARTGLGTCLLAQERADEAYDVLAAALTDDPDQPEALWALTPIYLQREQWSAASDALRRVLSSRGDDPMYWVSVGRAEAGQGNWDEAQGAFHRALELDESHATARRWFAISLRVDGNYRAAALALRLVVASNPDDGLAWLNLAIALGQLGEVAAAREPFVQARALMPGSPEPLFQEAHLALMANDAERALALAEQAVAADGDHPGALEVLARVHARRGDTAEAGELCAAARSHATGEAQRRYLEGLCRELAPEAADRPDATAGDN